MGLSSGVLMRCRRDADVGEFPLDYRVYKNTFPNSLHAQSLRIKTVPSTNETPYFVVYNFKKSFMDIKLT